MDTFGSTKTGVTGEGEKVASAGDVMEKL